MNSHDQAGPGTYFGIPYREQAVIFLKNASGHETARAEINPATRALLGIGFALLAIEHALISSREASPQVSTDL